MQKYTNLVELEKCCQTHIYLQNVASIQPLERALSSLPDPPTSAVQRDRASSGGTLTAAVVPRRRVAVPGAALRADLAVCTTSFSAGC